MVPIGPYLVPIGPYLVPIGPYLIPVGPYWALFGPIGPYLALLGPIWLYWALFDPIGPYLALTVKQKRNTEGPDRGHQRFPSVALLLSFRAAGFQQAHYF